ncbi:adenylate kinase [Toxoplasma gondii TgCatPRC2]|uniref:Adenylate kinase n=15 Tax=Toxoplasma gondii TaxID=5811 RepID=B9PU13_TOXGV|nr:adenylate kinase [Toxoplasma gondii ME49]EPR59878.1 adenylate kinase [Toxoplasma gondii GT1]ESS33822.1 adenylate kinase [Toxoplasma gondii VEG]KAF4644326.1 adenylate kinase [Toxoplasma gondii]KFG28934.1 adenylate kinase [Toxoplasma gondii p89]KFG42962.1 adenylate kinase [Toxoplasma gondii GAB2-2007-GAL-DOM2]KFG53175.1 adenylate kinase [Toxoplasma gondii FOU]KFG62546.1 adenylate kinase [Toxoplasma gondii RUB]KFH08748.1 adenylate kinase [Toxoplasma gondii VAND]KFH12188.1 adenylate kinase |eukprot:XP_002368272.1 adenylate kinase [Toxoplasma gondii ME49]
MERLSQLRRPLKLLFMGAPGVGKGTYASRLARDWSIPHISTGDLIREEIKAKTPLGQVLQEHADRGNLVPDNIVSAKCRQRLAQKDCARGWILDGFPRTVKQAVELGVFDRPSLCVHISLPDNFIVEKLLSRRICVTCGGIFNIADIRSSPYDLPPLLPDAGCSGCGGSPQLMKRDDDTEAVVQNRLGIYKRETEPILQLYQKEGILLEYHVTKGVKDLPDLSNTILTRVEQLNADS